MKYVRMSRNVAVEVVVMKNWLDDILYEVEDTNKNEK